MRVLTLLPIIGLLLNVCLQAEDSPIKSALPISMIPPEGWECIHDPEQLPKKVKLVYVGSGTGPLTPSINVACEETTMTIKEYVTLAKA